MILFRQILDLFEISQMKYLYIRYYRQFHIVTMELNMKLNFVVHLTMIKYFDLILKNKNYYHNSLQYYEPYQKWIVHFAKKWCEFFNGLMVADIR